MVRRTVTARREPRWKAAARRLVGVTAVVAGARYVLWRPTTLSGTGALGTTFYVCELLMYLYLTLTVAMMWRQRHRAGPSAPPSGTLDVFVTVCGEPVEMVEETLKAALAIRFPHRTYLLNDGYIAGKENWRDIEQLARRYGVRSFRRSTGSRRKAGNLNHALTMTDGEFVVVIDADHRADPDLAHKLLGYFEDDKLALVTTRQKFEVDAIDALGNSEVVFYDAIQPAKDAGGSVFSTGTGVVYRRAALDTIGGFSEWNVLEDLHTSYTLHAAGWQSLYHPEPVTIGTAPQTGASLVRQRLQWATDSLRIFFWDNPLVKKGLRPGQRLHYFHTVSYYLFDSIHSVFLLGPACHLLWQVPVMRPESLGDYLGHSLPYLVPAVSLIFLMGGLRGGLRGVQSSLALAPLYPIAILRALTGVRFRMRVNPKRGEPVWSMLLLPAILIAGLSIAALVFAFVADRGDPRVSAAWAAWTVFVLSGLVGTVSARRAVAGTFRSMLRLPAFAAVAILMIAWAPSTPPTRFFVPAETVSASAFTGSALPVSVEEPVRIGALAPPKKGAYIGAFHPEWLLRDGAVDDWSRRARVPARIVQWYQHWLSGETRFRADWLEMIAKQGAVPMITWEPWAKPQGSVHSQEQPDVSLAQIALGRHDDYIRSWARGAAAYGGPLIIRTMHEMNGNWYPWSIRTNANSEASFVAAWRHIHHLFDEAGATNVTWVWTLNSFAGMSGDNRKIAEYYPGDEYVDWVSVTGFNWGNSYSWNAWRTFDEVFRKTYLALYQFKKPIMLSEVGTSYDGGDASAWVRDTMQRLRSYPLVKAVVWFDSRYARSVDFRLQGGTAAAFTKDVLRDSYWRPVPKFSEPRDLGPAPPQPTTETWHANRTP